MSSRHSGRFIDDFPATAGFLLVIVGMFAIEVVLQSKLTTDPNVDLADHIMRIRARTTEILGSPLAGLVVHKHEVWRLLAACFLHYGLLHLAFNSLALGDLGRLCEPLLGTERFVTSYVVCGLGASATSVGWWASRHQWGAAPAGASGAIFGLIGLVLAFSIRHRDRMLRNSLMRSIIFIVLITLLIPGIDHAAHAGGFVTGFALGWFVPRYTSSASARKWRVPSWIAIAACAVAIGFSVWEMFKTLGTLGG